MTALAHGYRRFFVGHELRRVLSRSVRGGDIADERVRGDLCAMVALGRACESGPALRELSAKSVRDVRHDQHEHEVVDGTTVKHWIERYLARTRPARP